MVTDPFDELAGDLAAKLVAAGVPATLDPATLPPLVLVDVESGNPANGVGAWPTAVTVTLIAAPPADLTCRRWLTGTLTAVLRTAGYALWRRGTVEHAAKSCPAITVTYPLEAPNPDC